MANVTLGMPIFSGDPDEDVELFLDLFRGYLAGLGINPADNVGNPTGHSRAYGLLRGCMRGLAVDWFDRELTGKIGNYIMCLKIMVRPLGLVLLLELWYR